MTSSETLLTAALVALAMVGCCPGGVGAASVAARMKQKWQNPHKLAPPYTPTTPGTCPVKTVTVQKLGNTDATEGVDDAVKVLEHIGAYTGLDDIKAQGKNKAWATIRDPSKLPFADDHNHYLSCIDGRTNYAALGTPGGDLGEFILGLCAIESRRAPSEWFSEEQVNMYVLDYLGTREKFYMHTDSQWVQRWNNASNLPDALHPKSKEERLRALKFAPAFQGCTHINKMLKEPSAYQCRTLLVEHVIRSVLGVYIDQGHELRSRIEYVVLEGYTHEEGAFIDVMSPVRSPYTYNEPPPPWAPRDALNHYTDGSINQPDRAKRGADGKVLDAREGCAYHAPLVVPLLNPRDQLAIYHPRAVYESRANLARYLTEKEKKDPAWELQLFKDMVRIGNTHLKLTKQYLYSSIPTYLVRFT
eukprot:TRINITY_DN65833_c1_g1_i1.p1 TRINITY_DN65833_c1_g1~~TRINITY_DN65833_c1_g1_i1.p1  ORF type:complete len:438 (-),score=187.48 TRINITY_DN65833_c1_g1_i1:180-1430(-)